jgi:hypothetical protein
MLTEASFDTGFKGTKSDHPILQADTAKSSEKPAVLAGDHTFAEILGFARLGPCQMQHKHRV